MSERVYVVLDGTVDQRETFVENLDSQHFDCAEFNNRVLAMSTGSISEHIIAGLACSAREFAKDPESIFPATVDGGEYPLTITAVDNNLPAFIMHVWVVRRNSVDYYSYSPTTAYALGSTSLV